MNIKFFTFILALTLSCSALAQKEAAAKKVLDATASKLQKMKSVKAQFTITAFQGASDQGSTNGTMLLNGKRYRMETAEAITWFDGKTQWSYLPQNDEVNVTTPTKEEQAAMNPYAFITLYKKGFNYSLSTTSYQGKTMNQVRLTAESPATDIQEVLVVVTPDNVPVSVRIRQGKSQWTRIRISSLQSQKTTDADFTFPNEKYPNAEIIDLR